MTAASALCHTTLDLLELVQTVSGYPAVVTANRDLPTTAALRMARESAAVHTIEYNPELAAEPDYYVAVQCGQILRFFAPSAAERRDLAFSERGQAMVRALVQGEALSRLSGVPQDAAACPSLRRRRQGTGTPALAAYASKSSAPDTLCSRRRLSRRFWSDLMSLVQAPRPPLSFHQRP